MSKAVEAFRNIGEVAVELGVKKHVLRFWEAKFTQLKAQIEADTAIIRAKGEAEAIQVRGQALRDNPDFIRLQILQNWNGRSPLVVGTEGGANMMLSLDELNKHAAQAPRSQPRTPPSAGQPLRSK